MAETDAATTDAAVERARVLLVCCVLAEHFGPLALRDLDIPEFRITHTVAVELRDVQPDYVFRWRSRVTAWSVRWDAARLATARYFPDLPGAKEIPEIDALDRLDLSDAERAQLTTLLPL
ncbi:hypothetical protein [Amycolatopsis saalfeldensis]|uniref:Uncharacterized protein n=1 Tax=Amycolatopsis saalfeldensis TaxID=394193 RepID=A0A1H8YP40_9PSEU|nr:hypothetical protein [Amycolatopsis saalfeldensis]SEP53974.1 hypothetical protein SAMN04489732_13429 [Amycolatopsis saalfeldensis]